MWFARKKANRKIGREVVLDVKLRSSKVRAARTRMVALGLTSFFGLVLGAFLLYWLADWAITAGVGNHPAFAIKEIDVQTDGSISTEQLRRWTGIRPGANLFRLDLNAVRRQLELIPRVESVAIDRVPPSTLRIRVVERVPIARIVLPQPRDGGGIELKVYYIDAQGVVMLPLSPLERAVPSQDFSEQLPILAGLFPGDVQPGRRIQSPQVQAALQFIAAFDTSSMAGSAELKRIDVSQPEVLVVTSGQGSTVTFGLMDHERQLARWREIHDAALRLGKTVATLDLAITNNIPLTLADLGPAPPAPAKPAKPAPLRRKHV